MILYKYCPPVRVDILKTEKVRFTQPGNLNDPTESAVNFRKLDEPWSTFVSNAKDVISNLEKISEGTFEEFLNWLKPHRRPIIQRRILEMIWHLGTGIFSLSSTRTSEIMWSHYAQSHEGFVIGLDKEHPFFTDNVTAKVQYRNEIPQVEFFHDLDIELLACTKSKSWAYEKEWRVIRPLCERPLSRYIGKHITGDEICLAHLPASALVSITFGARMAPKLGREIIDALSKKRFRHIELYRAKFNASRRLKVLPCTISDIKHIYTPELPSRRGAPRAK
jgi:hypothetical protein